MNGPAMTPPPLPIEVWSDVVCPWCAIGKRRLESALALLEAEDGNGRGFSVRWRGFELDPSAPGTTREMLARKYGVSLAEADAMQARVADLAAREGLEFRMDRTRPANTFDAHRLLHFAALRDRQEELMERLFRAHFTDGLAVDDRDVLAGLAADAGLDAAEAREALESGAHGQDVRADEDRARRLGIRGVPFFLCAGRGVSGAQPAEALAEFLRAARRDVQRSLDAS